MVVTVTVWVDRMVLNTTSLWNLDRSDIVGRTVTVTVLLAVVLLALADADPEDATELCERLAAELAGVELDAVAEVALAELTTDELAELAETGGRTADDDACDAEELFDAPALF